MHYKGLSNKTILVKVTSRERYNELIKCIQEALILAGQPNKLTWLFSFDEDDYTDKECNTIEAMIPGECLIVRGISESKIHAINRDIDKVDWDWGILVNLSDDQLCVTQGWDVTIRNTMPAGTDASLWFNDGRQDRLNTMEILGRAYYNRFGYIYHPSYKSFYSDNEAHDVANKLGKLIPHNEVLFTHYHPLWAKDSHMKHDEVYKRAERHWDYDAKVYESRKAINFNL